MCCIGRLEGASVCVCVCGMTRPDGKVGWENACRGVELLTEFGVARIQGRVGS